MKDQNTLPFKATLLEAIQKMDKANMKIVLVLDEEQRLCGTVTDGDIRRSLLKGTSLQDPVTHTMNSHPRVASENTPQKEMVQLMRKENLLHLPILDSQRKVKDIFTLKEFHRTFSKDNWVVLMAGGVGRRLHPLTKDIPKPLLQVGNRPILETILNNFVENGYKNFFLSINYKGQMIRDHFGDGSSFGVCIQYLMENQALGTAGGLSLLNQKPKNPFIVMNGDLLTKVDFSQMIHFHLRNKAQVTLCVREYQSSIPFGVVDLGDIQVRALHEKPVRTHWINAGIYVLNPDILDTIPQNTYLDMTTLLNDLLDKKQKICAFPIREYWMDIGQPKDFAKAGGDYTEIFCD